MAVVCSVREIHCQHLNVQIEQSRLDTLQQVPACRAREIPRTCLAKHHDNLTSSLFMSRLNQQHQEAIIGNKIYHYCQPFSIPSSVLIDVVRNPLFPFPTCTITCKVPNEEHVLKDSQSRERMNTVHERAKDRPALECGVSKNMLYEEG